MQSNVNKRPFYFNPAIIISTAVALFLGLFLFSNYIKYQEIGVKSENELETMYQSNQNHLGQLSLKVKEALGVAKLNNAELNKLVTDAVRGRYGNEGESANQLMLWVQENYPGMYDPSLMLNVQQAILAGRTDFQAKQDMLLDRRRVYENLTQVFWSGLWLKFAGFPRENFNWKRYDPVLAEGTAEIFEQKVDKGFEIQ